MILLDTNALIWLALEPERLSKKAVSAIREATNHDGVAIASMTLWELAWLANARRIQFEGSVDAFVKDMAQRCKILELTAQIAVESVRLPPSYPRDPVDRVIGATAMVHGLALVTKNAAIRRTTGLNTVW